MTTTELPVIFFENAVLWETWLREHHAQPHGIWLKMAKKASGIPTVNYEEALQSALCYGWIDGQVKSLDQTHYLQKFTPRRPKSTWSKRNVERIAALEAAGRMQPSGVAEVEAAKHDGRWDQAYDSPSTMEVPEDFQSALKEQPKAKKFFETLNKTNRFAVLWQIQTARTPKTRQSRIEKLVQMLSEEQAPHIWK